MIDGFAFLLGSNALSLRGDTFFSTHAIFVRLPFILRDDNSPIPGIPIGNLIMRCAVAMSA